MRWITATLAEAFTASGAQVIFDFLGGLTQAEKLEIRKVVRIHFNFMYRANTDGLHVHGRFGLIVVTDDALAVNESPEPIQDSDASWLLNEFYSSERGDQEHEISRDIRAQRVIPAGSSLAFVLQSDTASDDSVHWSTGSRILLEH